MPKHTQIPKTIATAFACLSPLFFSPALAQIKQSPILKMGAEGRDAVAKTKGDVFVKLPFFDDFSQTKTRTADPLRWEPTGGTFVGNVYALNAPSLNVASFDGVDAAGKPYSPNLYDEGPGDTLASRLINLADFNPASKAALSFFWQAGGLGENPDGAGGQKDYLVLEFKKASGEWVSVWEQLGALPQEFKQEFIPLADAAYFHERFQFRFLSFGKLSGKFDVWNLDYVLLDINRPALEDGWVDFAASKTPSKLLKRYSSMPLAQLRDADLNDTIRTSLNSFQTAQNGFEFWAMLREANSSKVFGTLRVGDQNNTDYNKINYNPSGSMSTTAAAKAKQFGTHAELKKSLIPRDRPNLSLETRFVYNFNDKYKQNDTISSFTHFSDYLAYDDGTAEAAMGVSQRFAKLACEYQVNEPAFLTHVEINFPRTGQNREFAQFNLIVLKKLHEKGGADSTNRLHSQRDVVLYENNIDGFTTIKLTKKIPVDGLFYVVIEQLDDEMIPIGQDNNFAGGQYLSYKINNDWIKNTQIKGSIMMRPVLNRVVTGTDETLPQFNALLYPNPAQDEIRLDLPIEKAEVYSITGVRLLSFGRQQVGDAMDVSALGDGVYILKALSGGQVLNKRFVINK